MSALAKLARMLGIDEHQAEDALHSERAARAVLTRRNLFAASAAMAMGAAFSIPKPLELTGFFVTNNRLRGPLMFGDIEVRLNRPLSPGEGVRFEYSFDGGRSFSVAYTEPPWLTRFEGRKQRDAGGGA